MKRTALLLVACSAVAMAGCQTLHAHNPFRDQEPAYKDAQQEQPLEVPPGMNQPPATNALVIPTPQTSATVSMTPTGQSGAGLQSPLVPAGSATGAAGGASLVVSDTPANVYNEVGRVLQRSGVGRVTAYDSVALTYVVAVASADVKKPKSGFFHRLFHHDDHGKVATSSVTVSVVPEGAGSEVKAAGDPGPVARVMAALRPQLK